MDNIADLNSRDVNYKIFKTRVKSKIDYLSNWISSNPVLLDGEFAIVNDNGKLKLKAGHDNLNFNQLSYITVDSSVLSAHDIGAITSAETTLNLATGYTDWVCNPPSSIGSGSSVYDVSIQPQGSGWGVAIKPQSGGGWMIVTSSPQGNASSLSLSFSNVYLLGGNTDVTAYRTTVSGYRLGLSTGINADKILQPAGDYAYTADMSKYLPLSGGTVTGNLSVGGTTFFTVMTGNLITAVNSIGASSIFVGNGLTCNQPIYTNGLTNSSNSGKYLLVPTLTATTYFATQLDLTNYVQKSILVNGKKLSSDITLNANDVSAVSNIVTINGNQLTGDIILDAAAVSAATVDQIPLPSTIDPLVDGTASPGISVTFARGDHVHPTDLTRASQADMDSLVSGLNDSIALLTNWSGVFAENWILTMDDGTTQTRVVLNQQEGSNE